MTPKFRVWDIEQSTMFTEDDLLSIIFYQEDIYVEIDPGPFEDEYQVLDFEIMQSTGLKDKDGTEIYEGDLVDFNGIHEIQFGIHGVPRLETEEYVDTAAGFYFKPQHDLKDVKPFNLDIPLNDRYANECVVVGNIYKNPYLLEGNSNADD